MAAILAAALLLAGLPGEEPFIGAVRAERAGHFSEAAALYDQCAAIDGPLAPAARIRGAEALAAAGQTANATERFTTLLSAYSDPPWAPVLHEQRARAFSRQGNHAAAVEHYQAVLGAAGNAWWADQYQWLAAENLLKLPELAESGYPFFREVTEKSFFYRQRRDAAELLATSPDPVDRFDAVRALVAASAYPEANKVLATLQPGELVAESVILESQALRARITMGTGWPSEGRKRLIALADKHPGSRWARYALYEVAQNLAANRRFEDATALCERLETEYPQAYETATARWRLARAYDAEDKMDAAVREYLYIAETFPHFRHADAALYAASRHLRHQDQTESAQKALRQLVDSYPNSPLHGDALYWLGYLADEAGDSKAARQFFLKAAQGQLGDFYVHRALERLHGHLPDAEAPGHGLALGTGQALLRTSDIASLEERPLSENQREALDLIAFFAAHGLPEAEWLAREVLMRAEQDTDYRALAETGTAYTVLRDVGRLPGLSAADRLRIQFPRAYWPIVRDIAAEAGVDPYLILAIAKQESTFRPALTSNAGAFGAMQVMPATAREIQRRHEQVHPLHVDHQQEPANSFRLGAFYLQYITDMLDGNLVYAIPAYNAGPYAVRRWVRENGDADLDTFVEAIPYRETRGYIKKVLGAYAAYRSLYPVPAAGNDRTLPGLP